MGGFILREADEAKDWRYGQIWGDVASALQKVVSCASPGLLPAEDGSRINELTAPVSGDDLGIWSMAASATHSSTRVVF